jgi:AcrR family transcriptional regulator
MQFASAYGGRRYGSDGNDMLEWRPAMNWTGNDVHSDLRDACVVEATNIIAEAGVEALSLREVARRLGVSHQAPYRHFASRDHVLAEVVRRAFARFATALERAPQTGNARTDALAMGMAYVGFALTHPLEYRLMFGGALPLPSAHPEMMNGAREAFAILQRTMERVAEARSQAIVKSDIDRESLFVWSSLHGIVSLLRSDALNTLELDEEARQQFVAHSLRKIGMAMGIVPPTEETSASDGGASA